LNETLLFYRAGKLLDDEELIRLANLTGLSSLMRKDEPSTQIRDSHFCHGSSGLAQFYKVLYQESGNEKYLEGYEYWIEQTILLLEKDMKKDIYIGKEYNFLDGLVGVAFVLLSYISFKPLNWSKALFL
jgi:lantibiotic biosynthesis protein